MSDEEKVKDAKCCDPPYVLPLSNEQLKALRQKTIEHIDQEDTREVESCLKQIFKDLPLDIMVRHFCHEAQKPLYVNVKIIRNHKAWVTCGIYHSPEEQRDSSATGRRSSSTNGRKPQH